MSPEFSFPAVTYGISNLLFNSMNKDLTGKYCEVAFDQRSLPFRSWKAPLQIRDSFHLYLRLSQTRRAETIGRRYRRYFGIGRRNAWRCTVQLGVQPP